MRDGVFDHDGVSAPCIAAPHILPSALGDVLGLRDHKTFAAQYPTPHNCCVRFVAAVADGPRNTRYRVVASLTWTGLPPAGSDQLILTQPPDLRTVPRLSDMFRNDFRLANPSAIHATTLNCLRSTHASLHF